MPCLHDYTNVSWSIRIILHRLENKNIFGLTQKFLFFTVPIWAGKHPLSANTKFSMGPTLCNSSYSCSGIISIRIDLIRLWWPVSVPHSNVAAIAISAVRAVRLLRLRHRSGQDSCGHLRWERPGQGTTTYCIWCHRVVGELQMFDVVASH